MKVSQIHIVHQSSIFDIMIKLRLIDHVDVLEEYVLKLGIGTIKYPYVSFNVFTNVV